MPERICYPQTLNNPGEVTDVVISALLAVYDSQADLDLVDLLQVIEDETDFSTPKVIGILDLMLNKEVNSYLTRSTIEGQKIALSTAGLWLLEDAFMQGDDVSDGTKFVESQISRAGFLNLSEK